jgi:hypothetical protein
MFNIVPYLSTPLPALPAALTELQSEGGTVPGRSIAAARLIRKALVLELWPEVTGNSLQERALVHCCNQHCSARWWLLHKDQVPALIRMEITQLLAV